MSNRLSAVIEEGRGSTSTAYVLEETEDVWTDPAKAKAAAPPTLDNLSNETMGAKENQKNEGDKIQGWSDVSAAMALTWRTQRRHLFTSWVHVPIGICLILLCTWGLHLAVNASPWNFPAGLIGMLLFFSLLLLLDGLSLLFPGKVVSSQGVDIEKGETSLRPVDAAKERRRFVDPLMKLLAPPCDFLLRNMSILFITAFMMLPMQGAVQRKEVGLIVAWFFATQIMALLFPVAFCVLTGWIAKKIAHARHSEVIKKGGADLEAQARNNSGRESRASNWSGETAVGRFNTTPPEAGEQLRPGDVAQLQGNVVETARQQGEFASRNSLPSPGGWGMANVTFTQSYLPGSGQSAHPRTPPGFRAATPTSPKTWTAQEDAEGLAALAPNAVERLSGRLAKSITPAFYIVMFIVGLPLFYLCNFSLVLFLSVPVLAFLFAIDVIPACIRQFFHPILSGGTITFLVLWGLGEAKGMNIYATIQAFNHGTARYTHLLNPKGYHGPIPGAGDVFASLLDAALVALALPLYRYRYDLRDNFVRMFLALLPATALSLFAWPALGRLVGLSQVHALSFAARFMSADMGVKLTSNLDGDERLVTLLIVLTGVGVAIIKDPLFRLLRVPESDHLTWGVTVGTTGAAIGASSLVAKPRAMAIATLTYVLFGLIMLFATAFQPVVDIVHNLTGGTPSIIDAVGLGN